MQKVIRAANRQKWMKFCRERINWIHEKPFFFADETMVMKGNDQ